MTKQEVVGKVNEVVAAPSCCAELKAAGEEYLSSIGTEKEHEAAKSLIAELEADVMPIDAVIEFFESSVAAEKFGAKTATDIAAHAKDLVRPAKSFWTIARQFFDGARICRPNNGYGRRSLRSGRIRAR